MIQVQIPLWKLFSFQALEHYFVVQKMVIKFFETPVAQVFI